MLDWSQLRDLMWEARWDGLVVLAQALWSNVLTHWWFGPLLMAIALTATRRAWIGLLRYVGMSWARGGSSN
jgi:hypothetical protein